MSEIAIASLITAPESTNPLLEILWEIEQGQQSNPLIDLAIEQENLSEVTEQSQKQNLVMQRTLDQLKRANPIAAPMAIRGF
ncbi:MAG: hypothetical protein NW214_13535 [Pseudanabaenaceae cyanobacterium bins.39]|nr:hypothetical protein [Pseudanabaenaceae cyanobacterium bins.39]